MDSLSDSHNFGKRVFASGDKRLFKPRPLYWEWQVLGDSPLRHELKRRGLDRFLPRLKFEIQGDLCGQVERLELSAATKIGYSEFHSIGASIALFAWLGIADLHQENFKMGYDSTGSFLAASIDIENMLYDFEAPGATGILPTTMVPVEICGISRVLTAENKGARNAAAACLGFITQLEILIKSEKEILSTIVDSTIFRSVPLRVVIRKTLSYHRYLQRLPQLPIEIPMTPSEIAQLERGDVPYFFRFADRPGIYCYISPSRYLDVSEEIKNSGFKLDTPRMVKPSGISKRVQGGALAKNGLVQIARGLTIGKLDDEVGKIDGCLIELKDDRISIKINNYDLCCKRL